LGIPLKGDKMNLVSNPFIWAAIAAIVYIVVTLKSKEISFFHLLPALLFIIPGYLFIAQGSYIFFTSYVFFCLATICTADLMETGGNALSAMLGEFLFGAPFLISSILCVIFLIWGCVHQHKLNKLNEPAQTQRVNVQSP
jgi:hypothetical protein